jgi:hypothetical protein
MQTTTAEITTILPTIINKVEKYTKYIELITKTIGECPNCSKKIRKSTKKDSISSKERIFTK